MAFGFRSREPDWAGKDVGPWRPRRLVAFEQNGDDEPLQLLVPRFRSWPFSRLLQPSLRPERAYVRVSLDPRGAALWKAMDGETTVGDLIAFFQDAFPGDAEQAADRVWIFLPAMKRHRFLAFDRDDV